MTEIQNPKNPYHPGRAGPGLANAWEQGHKTGRVDGVSAAHASRQSQIRDLELAEALAKNAQLGGSLYGMEAEIISCKAKISELEARLTLESRRPLGLKIHEAMVSTESHLHETQKTVSQKLGVMAKGLTSASLKND